MAYSYNIKRKKRLPYLLDTDDAAKDHMALAAQAAKGGDRPYQDAVIQSAGPTPKGREYAASQYDQDPAANAPPTASGANALESYYRALLGLFSVPGVTVPAPTYDELGKTFESIIRPGVDTAIENRYEAGARNMAELEADAYSRGMGSSSFVSSMNAREQDDVQSDIAAIEAQYAAAIAEQLYKAMNTYNEMNLQAQMFNAQMRQNAQNSAAARALDMYGGRNSQSGGDRRRESPGLSESAYSGLSLPECENYIESLSQSERNSLFAGSTQYWRARRNEIINSLGAEAYERLKSRYHRTAAHGSAGARGTTSGGGHMAWQLN